MEPDPKPKAIPEDKSKIHYLDIPEIEAETADEYLRKRYEYPPFDYSKAPKPFPVRFITRHSIPSSSDSDSDDSSDSESYSASHSDTKDTNATKAIPEDKSKVHYLNIPEIEAKTADEYLRKRYEYPPFDYSKAPEPFPVRFITRHSIPTSSSSSSDSDSDDSLDSESYSDSRAIAEEESEIQKENSPKDSTKELEFQPHGAPEQDKTPAQLKEESLDSDFDFAIQANKPLLVQLAKSSTTELMSGPPASSILVKHGTKRTTEAGDTDSKRAKEMEGVGKKSTDNENEGGGA